MSFPEDPSSRSRSSETAWYDVPMPPPTQRARHAGTSSQHDLRDSLATACVCALLVILVAVAVIAVDVMFKVLHG